MMQEEEKEVEACLLGRKIIQFAQMFMSSKDKSSVCVENEWCCVKNVNWMLLTREISHH
jgi:hypothetical protein